MSAPITDPRRLLEPGKPKEYLEFAIRRLDGIERMVGWIEGECDVWAGPWVGDAKHAIRRAIRMIEG